MTDACIVCETEPIDDSDWYRCEKTMEVICPWCVKDLHKIGELVKTHDGSDYHARKIFDEIQLMVEEAR